MVEQVKSVDFRYCRAKRIERGKIDLLCSSAEIKTMAVAVAAMNKIQVKALYANSL